MSQVFPSGGQVLELVFSTTVQTYILEFEASGSESVETAHWGQSWERTQTFSWLLVFSFFLLLLFFVFIVSLSFFKKCLSLWSMCIGEVVGWHHWLSGHEYEHTPGDSEGQVNLVCCSPWGCKDLDTAEWLNNSSITYVYNFIFPKEVFTALFIVPQCSCYDNEFQLYLWTHGQFCQQSTHSGVTFADFVLKDSIQKAWACMFFFFFRVIKIC